jgi:hypothetical protein
MGWGLCSHVSAVYVALAREAGYEARVWGLSGHVVPEIRVGDRWQVYDPDLAIYYFNSANEIASLVELQTDATLVSSPVNPIFDGTDYDFPYSSMVADIYGSSEDNYIGEQEFIPDSEGRFQAVVLPPGASLVYPGRWSTEVIGLDGPHPNPVPHFLQAKLTTPADFSGDVVMPWMLWEIRGNGRVRIDDVDYEVGSQGLRDYIHLPEKQITSVTVIEAGSPIEFISFVNAVRYELAQTNDIRVTGRHVWAVDISLKRLEADALTGVQTLMTLAKPAP